MLCPCRTAFIFRSLGPGHSLLGEASFRYDDHSMYRCRLRWSNCRLHILLGEGKLVKCVSSHNVASLTLLPNALGLISVADVQVVKLRRGRVVSKSSGVATFRQPNFISTCIAREGINNHQQYVKMMQFQTHAPPELKQLPNEVKFDECWAANFCTVLITVNN